MIHMLTASTDEIDDSENAVEEILAQLNVKERLKKNTVGIIACAYEFIDTGVVAALCKALPFETVGVTTLGNAAAGRLGLEVLSITVLTSDDAAFKVGSTPSLAERSTIKDNIQAAYTQTSAGKTPVMVLAYPPLIPHIGGGVIFHAIEAAVAAVPIFGTIACDQSHDCHLSKVIYNGKAASDIMAFVLLFGEVQVKFTVTTIPDTFLKKQPAIITEADGNILKKINNLPLIDYLKSVGLIPEASLGTVGLLPLLIDYRDGTKPVARSIYSMTAEGWAVCGDEMPLGGAFSIGAFDYQGVLDTADLTLQNLLEAGKQISGILLYPCMSRSLMIAPNSEAEMQRIADTLEERYPYSVCYAGGEIGPLPDHDGKLVNYFHNYSFVACAFQY
ncbi:FIST N-terminal domain-containing protein [Breznakiellaceae bacterium SP9]